MTSALLSILHTLAAAAWFGSMFYSLTVLHPRAKRYFKNDREFEDFIATLAQGARYKVLSAIGFIALTGVLLIPFRPHPRFWWALILAKILLLLGATFLFSYASWVLWPRRIFASDDEIPLYQRRFRQVGLALLLIVFIAIALGVLAHCLV